MKQNHKGKVLFVIITSILLTLCTQNIFAQKIKDGKATYYSGKLYGRRMSNGEYYHPDSMTCAHRTLPFGTRILVTNPRNGNQVVVRVTDRGSLCTGQGDRPLLCRSTRTGLSVCRSSLYETGSGG